MDCRSLAWFSPSVSCGDDLASLIYLTTSAPRLSHRTLRFLRRLLVARPRLTLLDGLPVLSSGLI
jgi:hypothetical protein